VALQAAINEVQDSFEDFEAEQTAIAYEPTPINRLAYWAMYPCATTSVEALAYLKSRGISAATATTLELRFDPEEQRILFPVYCGDGKLYGLTGRSILSAAALGRSPKVKNYAGLKKEYRLLGEQLVPPDNDKPFLVVEGLFALAHLVEIGVCNFCNPVAVMGSSLSEAQRDLLVGYDKPVYLCFDDDPAGSQGLFGAFKKDGKGYAGNGAVDKLRQHVPTMVCLYPLRTNEVDDLTLAEVKRMIDTDHELA
jgi:DNA primase